MELTKEHFDEVIGRLATKEDLVASKEEILFRVMDAVASVEENTSPDVPLLLLEQKLNRLEQILHVEL